MLVPESDCPYCDYHMDGMTCLQDGYAVPVPGDISVCISCAQILMVTDELTVRKPTDQEYKEIKDRPDVKEIQRRIRLLDRTERK